MRESDIETLLIQLCNAQRIQTYKLTGSPGLPDRLLLTPMGRVVFVELKQESGRVANHQRITHTLLRKNNADVRVATGEAEVRALVADIVALDFEAANYNSGSGSHLKTILRRINVA